MERLSRFLSAHASLITCLAALAGYLIPNAFAWVIGVRQTLILGFIMLTMGLTLTTTDFKILVSRPVDIIIGSAAQYTVMPLVAFGISWLLGLDPGVAAGLILVGCCPGGVSSNLMSYLCKGDVAYSVGMTTVSTLLSPVLTPALVLLLVGESIDVDAWGMFRNILIVTLLPISIGFCLNLFFGSRDGFARVRTVMPSLSVIGLALIVGGVVCQISPSLSDVSVGFLAMVFLSVLLHNGIGYALGYLVATLSSFSTPKKRTLSIEVGMQNAGLATNLSSAFFAAANPLSVLPCAISCAWHSISGTLIANFFAKSSENKK